MDKAQRPSAAKQMHASRKLDWRRKMSDNVAYALLVYTGLQIFWTMTTLKTGHGSALPYLALVVLIAAIIPACRLFEKRWAALSDSEAANPEFASRFRRDQIVLWLCALGLPLVLTGVFRAITALF
ncbi:MAG: hypothetical protein J0I69_05510 [Altererythrobacter sp.]|nr:hypothetical protein [Altererythrobacter sp.]OJU60629.1 MAG: hypothetical protein BGO08_10620 [Altererythrobacter sp. 66-12]